MKLGSALFQTASIADQQKSVVANALLTALSNSAQDRPVPVTFILTPSEAGAKRGAGGKFPPTVLLTEEQIEKALFKHFGFDVSQTADFERVKRLLQTEDSPFSAVKTTGSFTATSNANGEYEIRGEVEADLYRKLQGKAVEVQAQVTQSAEQNQSASVRPGESVAGRSGYDPKQREALEQKLGNAGEANTLLADDALKQLDAEAKARKLAPTQRAIRSLDVTAELLDGGHSLAAAQVLESEAKLARAAAAKLDPASAEARALIAFADNAEARAGAYRATAPKSALDAARQLYQTGSRTIDLASELERQGRTAEVNLLRAIGNDSRVQAEVVAQGAINTNSLIGQGLAQTYQQVVDASFDKKIAETGTLFGSGTRDRLVADKQKMAVVFNELNRIMQEEGVSLDRAWSMMFNDATIDGWRGQPRRVPGFPTRKEAAIFLRDHEVTRNLLSPFSDMARGFYEGDARVADKGQADMIRALRQNDQWEIARQLLDSHLKQARSTEGQVEARQLDASERGEWWKAKSAEFARRELPVLILSGVVSGGAGWGVRAIGAAAQWGPRVVRGAQVATELGAFVPTERVLNELVNGRKADWSAGALARDYAFTLGGYGLTRALGKGWQYFRDRGAGKGLVSKPYTGPPIDDAINNINKTIQTLDDAIPLGSKSSKQTRKLVERTEKVAEELRLLRDSLKNNPSAAGKAAVERLTKEADELAKAAKEYGALRRPELLKNQRATPEQLEAHRAALERYAAQEARLREALTQRIERYAEKLFLESAELAGVTVSKYNPVAGHFKNDPLPRIFEARRRYNPTPEQNVGYAELRLGNKTDDIGPAVSGSGAGSLPRTSPGLVDETRALSPRPGRHNYPRANDSEAQLMEQAMERLKGNPNAAGTLRIYTEQPPCPSCLRVMAKFRQLHPNIKIEVFYSEKHALPWTAWLLGQQGRDPIDNGKR